MTRILVTGASGQLGNELQQLASSYPSFQFIFLSRDELSIEQAGPITRVLEEHSPGYVINCAAYTAVDKAEEEKDLAFRINVAGAGNLAIACEQANARLIHISTDYVFNGLGEHPYKEDAATDPQSVYGSSKLEGEKLVIRNAPSALIIRTSWLYSEYGKNFVKTILRLMGGRNEINVVNDQLGSPTYAADLAEAILSIIQKQLSIGSGQGGIYHFSNKGIVSWYDLAVAIKELTGSDCRINPIPTSSYPTPAKRPAYSVLDTTKIQKEFGIEIKDWKESLRRCLSRLK